MGPRHEETGVSGHIQQSHQLANTVGEKRHPAGCKLFSVVWRKQQHSTAASSTAAVSQALLDFKGQDVILASRPSPLPVDSLTGGPVNRGLIYLVVCVLAQGYFRLEVITVCLCI